MTINVTTNRIEYPRNSSVISSNSGSYNVAPSGIEDGSYNVATGRVQYPALSTTKRKDSSPIQDPYKIYQDLFDKICSSAK